jgi:hypothetical protein
VGRRGVTPRGRGQDLNAHARFVEEPEPVTTTVEELTGTPARTFRGWASDHADDF